MSYSRPQKRVRLNLLTPPQFFPSDDKRSCGDENCSRQKREPKKEIHGPYIGSSLSRAFQKLSSPLRNIWRKAALRVSTRIHTNTAWWVLSRAAPTACCRAAWLGFFLVWWSFCSLEQLERTWLIIILVLLVSLQFLCHLILVHPKSRADWASLLLERRASLAAAAGSSTSSPLSDIRRRRAETPQQLQPSNEKGCAHSPWRSAINLIFLKEADANHNGFTVLQEE